MSQLNSKKKTPNNQIRLEEQNKLDSLIQLLEQDLSELRQKQISNAKKYGETKKLVAVNPDAYGLFIELGNEKKQIEKDIQRITDVRRELYGERLNLLENGKNEEFQLAVGLHEYSRKGTIYIISWLRKIAVHFSRNNLISDYTGTVLDDVYTFTFHLRQRRQIIRDHDTVIDVIQFFPKTENEQVIFDEFLNELLRRRNDRVFRNIVFSIQNQQKRIIQAPLEENILVQGCAGSGKSMIMLHRLPVLAYEYSDQLRKEDIYVITPSESYMKMVDNMLSELEIREVSLGTLKQYYNSIIEQYGHSSREYGTGSGTSSYEIEKKAFSNDMRLFIDQEMLKCRKRFENTIKQGFAFLNLPFQSSSSYSHAKGIRENIFMIDRIMETQNKTITAAVGEISQIADTLETLKSNLQERPSAVAECLGKMIIDEQAIHPHSSKLKQLELIRKTFAADVYFEQAEGIADQIELLLQNLRYTGLRNELTTDNNTFAKVKERQYDLVLQAPILKNFCNYLISEIDSLGWKYEYYEPERRSFESQIKSELKRFGDKEYHVLSKKYNAGLQEAAQYYKQLLKDLPIQTYERCMKELDNKKVRGNYPIQKYSPYLFTQILYCFYGPLDKPKKLIAIDEAQRLSPIEIGLIRRLNGKKVIMNLYGDVDQCTDKDHGINDWSRIDGIEDYSQHLINTNYRNPKEIADYCNLSLDTKMESINPSGDGVIECSTGDEFADELETCCLRTRQNYSVAIIVSDDEELEWVIDKAEELDIYDQINDMSQINAVLSDDSPNLFTLDQVNGLEFGIVLCISGRMSRNEKYIAYTRALDKLVILDEDIEGLEDRHISLKEFFERRGLEVIDNRNQSGALWVVGEKKDIAPFIEEACRIYNVCGFYSAGKATGYRPAWYTKNKE